MAILVISFTFHLQTFKDIILVSRLIFHDLYVFQSNVPYMSKVTHGKMKDSGLPIIKILPLKENVCLFL